MYIAMKVEKEKVKTEICNDLKEVFYFIDTNKTWEEFNSWARLNLSVFGYFLIKDKAFVKEVGR